MYNKGFVKIHRKFTEWEWYTNTNTKVVFIHLLLTANHKATKFRGADVPIGSIVTGYDALAAQLSLSVQNVRTAIKHLKLTGEVTVKVTNSFSVLTLVKWEDYQDREKIESYKKAPNQQATNKQLTSDQQATNRRLTASKECKNVRMKERKTNAKINFASFPSVPDADLIADWFKVRKAKRMVNTQVAIDAIGKKMTKAVKAGYSVDQCLRIMVEKSWGGLELEWLAKAVEIKPVQSVVLKPMPANWDEWHA